MTKRVQLDSELVELFADDPELLAIVDAISATQRPPAAVRRRRQLVIVAAATIAVLSIGIGIFSRQASHAGVIERALRAFNEHRVLHVTIVESRVDGQLIDLRTGARRQLRHVIDEWYDSARGVRGLRDSVRGVVVVESRGLAKPSDANGDINSFVQAYRQGLARRDVQSIQPGHVGHRAVYWLVFRDSGGMQVAVARDTARPVLIRYRRGVAVRDFRVVAWGGAVGVPLGISSAKTDLTGQLRRLRPSALPSLAERSMMSSLRSVGGLPKWRMTNRFVIVGSGARAYEFVFASKPVSGRIKGGYLRLAVSPRPLTAFGWSPVEASIPEQSLLLFTGPPTYVYARPGGTFTAIESTLPRQIILSTVRALQAQ
jgi:hypothetical protein